MLEIFGSIAMGGLLLWVQAEKKGTSDASKIQKIARKCKLYGEEKEGIHLLTRRKREWGNEYVYRIPLGLSFDDFQAKRRNFEDGLNVRQGIWDSLPWGEFRNLKIDKNLSKQLKEIIDKHKKRGRKEIIMDFDGTLIMRVYNSPLPKKIDFTDSTLKLSKGWKIYIGESREGSVFHNFEHYVHIIVAGTTRYGKSVFLKGVITTLINNKPDNSKLHLIDLKGGLAFQRFKDTKQVQGVAKDAFEALDMLRKVEEEMKQRQKEFLKKGYEDITEASYKNRDFIIVDEAAELTPQKRDDTETRKAKSECEKILAEIARIGGGLGYRLVYATQYPTADVLPRQIKQNAPSKLCFLLDTETASRVVLDEGGAESLPWIKGRAIYKTDRKKVVQTPFIENTFIKEVITPHITIKSRGEKVEPKERTESGQNTIKFEES